MENFESNNQKKYPKGNPYIDKYRKEMSTQSYGITPDMKFDPITGKRVNDVPKFDPQTGKPLSASSLKFDPKTGLPIGANSTSVKPEKGPSNIGKVIATIIFIAIFGVAIYFGAKNWDTISHQWLGEPYEITWVVGDKTTTTKVKEGVVPSYDTTIWEDENTVYKITGWDKELVKVDGNTTYTATVQEITKPSITFNGVEGATNNNSAKFNPLTGLVLQSPSKVGYDFAGWYTDSSLSEEYKITKIDENTNTNVTLYAKFNIIEYTISFVLNNSTITDFQPIFYTISSTDFTLPTPIKGEKQFKGWSSNRFDGFKTVIPAGTYGNIELTAHFVGDDVVLTYYFGDTILKTSNLIAENSFTVDTIEMLPGYELKGWYKDSALTQANDYTAVPEENFNLYAKVDYLLGYGYLDNLTAFTSHEGTTSDPVVINSKEQFIDYIDYIYFNYITADNDHGYVKYNFTTGDITTFMREILNVKSYPSTIAVSYSEPNANSVGVVRLSLDSNFKAEENQSEFTHTTPLVQYNIGTKEKNNSKRSSDFNDFNINKVGITLECSSSDQLFYALEQGFKPVCVPGSKAESIYNKAKVVLRDIVNDNMSDLQKTKAIYEWLVENVEYDYVAFNASTDTKNPLEDTYKYAAWALEGVFDKGYAVCDGISKALVVLTRIEGIPSIRVTGNAHAWNRVYINEKWYGVDATHANVGLYDKTTIVGEGFSYSEFMFSDAEKTAREYTGDNFKQFAATESYDFYNNYSVTGTIKMLSAEGVDDGDLLLYVYNQYKDKPSGTKVMVDLAISKEDDDAHHNDFIAGIQSCEKISGKMTYKFCVSSEVGDLVIYSFAFETI